MDKIYDIAILGSGPGGYVAAIRAAQLGLSVCLIEKHKLGGVCLNYGCIPTKSLLKSAEALNSRKKLENLGIKLDNFDFDFSLAQKRKTQVVEQLNKGVAFILKKHKVDILKGHGRIVDNKTIDVEGKKVKFENCIIAVGSKPAQLDNIKLNKEQGIISSREILGLNEVPRSLLIIGGGVIGCEFGYIFNSMGTSVTIVEVADQLVPGEDTEIMRHLEGVFKKQGIKIFTKSQVKSIAMQKDGMKEAVLDSGQKILAERVLLAVGRRPNFEDSGISELGIRQENGRILVNERMQTNIDRFYAIGDVVGLSFLAHVASRQGIIATENIAGCDSKMDYHLVPRCMYTIPQVASVGKSQAQATREGKKLKIGKFPFSASGKAVIEQAAYGWVKLIFDAQNDKILGASIYGTTATELIHQISIAMKAGLTIQEISEVIYAHPTLSESIMEAAEATQGQAIHIA